MLPIFFSLAKHYPHCNLQALVILFDNNSKNCHKLNSGLTFCVGACLCNSFTYHPYIDSPSCLGKQFYYIQNLERRLHPFDPYVFLSILVQP